MATYSEWLLMLFSDRLWICLRLGTAPVLEQPIDRFGKHRTHGERMAIAKHDSQFDGHSSGGRILRRGFEGLRRNDAIELRRHHQKRRSSWFSLEGTACDTTGCGDGVTTTAGKSSCGARSQRMPQYVDAVVVDRVVVA